jgi:hypothetical protein
MVNLADAPSTRPGALLANPGAFWRYHMAIGPDVIRRGRAARSGWFVVRRSNQADIEPIVITFA